MGRFRPVRETLQSLLARITVRLRIALVLVVIVTAVAGAAAITQARILLANYATYQSTARPMLELAQNIRRDVRRIATALDSMAALRQDRDLVDLTRDLTDLRGSIHRDLAGIAELGGSPALLAELEQQLDTGHQSVLGAISDQSKFLQAEERLDQIIVDVLDRQTRAHALLEDMNFQVTSESDLLIRQAPDGNGTTVANRNARLAALFQDTLHLNEIGYSLDSVVNAALTMRELGGSDASLRPTFLAHDELRGMISTLAQFPDNENRRALAGTLAEIRHLIISENGFFELQRQQYAMLQKAMATRSAYLPILGQTAVMADRLVSEMLDAAEGSALHLQQALERLVSVLIGTVCFAILAILLTNHFIVERQFSRRMARLTGSTRAIAAGNLSEPVPVNGSDELGEMAEALRVFRSNAEDLKRSNIELEKFAYVAAHDLRAPLRAISDLAVWIEEDEENTVSAESHAYLTLLQERIRRLDRLLRDLLAYARAGTTDPEKEWIALEPTVRDQLRLVDPEGHLHLRYEGPDCLVLLEPTAFQQVLANIFVNALRHHDQPRGILLVRARTGQQALTLEIEDDGPGIPVEYQQKVFELFQTLRPRDEVEGSGLGLAIVRKLVDRQAGDIALISNPAQQRGTLFRLTLPLEIPAKAAQPGSEQAA